MHDRVMQGVRPCRKTDGKQERRDKSSNALVAERELFTDASDDEDEQRKCNQKDPVDRWPIEVTWRQLLF